MPYNGTGFHYFYTNSTFKPSCESWIDIEIPASWDDSVPAATEDAPGSSRLLKSQ